MVKNIPIIFFGTITRRSQKEGLRLVYEKRAKPFKSALEVAGDSVGKFKGGPKDLSTNKKYMEGFGR